MNLGRTLIFGLVLLPTWASADLSIVFPKKGAVVLGEQVQAEVQSCRSGSLDQIAFEMDGKAIFPKRIQESPFSGRAYFSFELPAVVSASHTLRAVTDCGRKRYYDETEFEVGAEQVFEPAMQVARTYMNAHPRGALKWDWGQAVFLFGLAKMRRVASDSDRGEIDRYFHEFYSRWEGRLPRVNRSDRCAAALPAVELAAQGLVIPEARSSIDQVANYIQTEPRNAYGTIDHLGHSFFSKFWPDSVWVDSLMMFGVFSTQWGKLSANDELFQFGANQPAIFDRALRDPDEHLYKHSRNVRSGKLVPSAHAYWLRGNGWALVANVEILSQLSPTDTRVPKIQKLIQEQAQALLQYQLPDGSWDSILNVPGYIESEMSGTGLVGYGLLKAFHHGWLGAEYRDSALKAFHAMSLRLTGDYQLRGLAQISGPTNPGSMRSYRNRVKIGSNIHYGLGAYLMLASEIREQ